MATKRRKPKPLKLDAFDVSIDPLPPQPCEDCDEPATRRVVLNLRSNGHAVGVYEGCEPHAERYARRLRASLPGSGVPE